MSKLIKGIIFLICITVVYSCKQEKLSSSIAVSKNALEKVWRLTEVQVSDDFYHSSSSLDRRKVEGQISQGYLLSIFPNGEVTKLLANKMSVYQWTYFSGDEDKKPSIIFQNEKEKDTLSNIEIEEVKGFLFMTGQYNNIGLYKFHLEYEMLEDFKLDPYFSENNKWRIASKTYESQKELKNRIFNYLNHCKALLISSTQRKNTKIRLKNSEGILRIFDGGIGLKSQDKVNKKWIHRFYSDSQAHEVYDRLEKHFDNYVIIKKTSAGWRLDDASIIDSLISVY